MALPVGPYIPVPSVYFPFTNDSVHSWPIPQYWGYNTSAIRAKQTRFVKDDYFGTVIQCNATAGAPARILCCASQPTQLLHATASLSGATMTVTVDVLHCFGR